MGRQVYYQQQLKSNLTEINKTHAGEQAYVHPHLRLTM